jgi:hypothetical protein
LPVAGGVDDRVEADCRRPAGNAQASRTANDVDAGPTPAGKTTKKTAARIEQAEVASADRGYDEAQAAVASMRARADELADEVLADLRFNLRKLDGPSQRRVMRTYGARYGYLEGEPKDADDSAPAAAAE